jgi:23S rRNA pseudouridine955/2504/2580 synthase
MTSPITLPVRDADGEVRLDRFLRRKFPHLAQARIEQMIRKGQIRIDGTRAKKASDRLMPGMDVFAPQEIAIPVKPADPDAPKRTKVSPADEAWLRGLVLHEDADMIVLAKPAGIAVQGGTGQTRSLDAMMDVFTLDGEDGRPRLCHRLDKDTSGCLVFGRTPAAASFLTKAFAGRKTTKIYWAVCLGTPHPMSGEIRGWLKKSGSARNPDMEMVRRAKHGDPVAQFAITDYEVVSNAGTRASFVALKPVTGRTHQLRFHMAETGCAIAGDPKYVCDRPPIGGLDEQLHLHARAIEIPHPKGGLVKVVAPLPPHMVRAFDLLGFHESEAGDPFAPFRRK